MVKSKEIAIVICAAHKADASRVTQGNKASGEAAKTVTGYNKLGSFFTLRDLIPMHKVAPRMS